MPLVGGSVGLSECGPRGPGSSSPPTTKILHSRDLLSLSRTVVVPLLANTGLTASFRTQHCSARQRQPLAILVWFLIPACSSQSRIMIPPSLLRQVSLSHILFGHCWPEWHDCLDYASRLAPRHSNQTTVLFLQIITIGAMFCW